MLTHGCGKGASDGRNGRHGEVGTRLAKGRIELSAKHSTTMCDMWYAKRRCKMRWIAFRLALVRMGFLATDAGGSIWQFRPPQRFNLTNPIMFIYRRSRHGRRMRNAGRLAGDAELRLGRGHMGVERRTVMSVMVVTGDATTM